MNVILVCNLGISSGLLIKKLNAVLKEEKTRIEVQPMGLEEVLKQKGIDVILVSPQVGYAKKQLLEVVKEKNNLYCISSFDYSSLNAKHIFEEMKDMLEKGKYHETGNS